MLRSLGWLFLLGSLCGVAGEIFALELPTVRFPFNLSRELNVPSLGWIATSGAFLVGIFLLTKFRRGFVFTPITERRLQRFRSIRRGRVSLIIIILLSAVAALDHVLVGNEALAVKYQGNFYFPAFTRMVEKGELFGITGDASTAPAQYRSLREEFRGSDEGDWVLMPLVPYAPTGDTVSATSSSMTLRDGLLVQKGTPFSGLAATIYTLREPERMHLRHRYRNGLRDGPAEGWDTEGNRVYGITYRAGKPVVDSERWNGHGSLEDFLALPSIGPRKIHYPPAPPSRDAGQFHLLGTTSRGYDVLAYVFGGLQVNFQAALFYIPLVYLIGVTVGLLMGYFGGAFDIVVQRLIEIFSNIPFLFVVMIASTSVPERLKETAGLWIILIILLVFGWMGMTYFMRTAALKEKARDYIASSRIIGSSTPRILFKHLLPNSVAIVVTLIPFSVSGLVLSLTSLDYLGFGLPPKYATWGQLLRDGLENLSSPWLVTSSFLCLVSLLVLITFIGEAVREAFDPKKFSYYR